MKFIVPVGILLASSSISSVWAGENCIGEPKLIHDGKSCDHLDSIGGRFAESNPSKTVAGCQAICIAKGATFFSVGRDAFRGGRCYCYSKDSSCPGKNYPENFNTYEIGAPTGNGDPPLIEQKRICTGGSTGTKAASSPEECNQLCLADGSKYFASATPQQLATGDTRCLCQKPAAGEYQDVCETEDGRKPQNSFNVYKTCYPYPDMQPGANGDPHFKTWTGERYDFHGECDLVLLENPNFNDGLGLHIHMRTKITNWWSSIRSAAVRLGDSTLEITGEFGDQKSISYWLDGAQVVDMQTGDATLGDYSVHFRRINDHQSQTRIDLGNGNALAIETFKHFVRVNIKADKGPQHFQGSYGMLGSFGTGEKIGRDKETKFDDPNEFGQEWQVAPTDPKIFHEESHIQHPQKCLMPDVSAKKEISRRLGEALITKEQAAKACARAAQEDREAW